MKKVNIFSVAILCVSCLFSSSCYAKDISESEVKKIEAEAKQKALEIVSQYENTGFVSGETL